MKKFISENKIYIFIGLLVLIFGLLLFWPQGGSNQKQVTSNKNGTKIVGVMQRPEEVVWKNEQVEIPKNGKVLEQKGSFINADKLETLMNAVGMKGARVEKSDAYYVIYRKDKTSLYLKLKEKQIDFQSPDKTEYKGEKSSASQVANLKNLVKSITNREITEPEIEYFKNEYRAIRSDIKTADFMEITSNFLYEYMPVMSYQGGPSIKAQYGFDGKLRRLMIFNPFDEPTANKEISLVTFEEIKKMPASSFPIFDIKGNRDFVMSTGEEAIKMINGQDSQMAYVFEPVTSTYVPYLITKGKTELESGETEIIFGVPLTKQ
jgi:hypothetical protein